MLIHRKTHIILFLYLLSAISCYGLGMKIVRPFNEAMLGDAMPWQIDEVNDWIYIASEEGLIQYDGSNPELFQFNNRRPVRSVYVDSEKGHVLAGGIGEFGYFKPSPITSLEYVCLSDSIGDDKNIGNIWGIYPKGGNIIAQGDNALLIYEPLTGKHILVEGGCKLDVSSLINDVLWLGTDDGLKLLLGNHLVNAPNAERLKGKKIRKILQYGDGILIITTDGIWKYENQHLNYLSDYEDIITKMGEIFSGDIHGNILALGSVSHGLCIIDIENSKNYFYDEKRGLPSNTVLSLKFDHTGNILTGMQYGLAKILLNQPIESLENPASPIGSGYVLAQRGNNLYFGTNRGLYHAYYDTEKHKIENDIKRVGNLRGQVWGLSIIDGEVLGSMDNGLYLIDKNNDAHQISDLTGVWDVRKMLSSADRAYAGSYSGLHLFKKINGEWKYESPVEGYSESMYNFVQEKPDVIWNDKSENGIDRIVIDTLRNKVIEIQNFKETNDGNLLTADIYLTRIDNNIYFGTPKGIYIYDPETGEILKEKELSRLLGNPKSVKRIKKVNGGLLALTENELLEADPAGILDMKRIPLSPSISRPMHMGDLFFPIGNEHLGYPTRNGYLIFDYSDPSNPYWEDNPPKVLITNVKLPNHGDSVIYKANFGGLKHEPELTYKENALRIEYGSAEDLEKGILYSTRINNDRWSNPSPTLNKDFNDLKAGKYKFEVKAISPAGKESIDYFTFKITPPWWKNNWMLIIYALFLISLVFLLVRNIQLWIERRQRTLLKEKDLEMARQHEAHQKETLEKDRQIEALEREKLDKEIKHKAQEVANVMLSLSHKNDTLQTVKRELQNILRLIPRGHQEARNAINELQEKVVVDIKSDDVLQRVEDEFDIIHDNFMKKLREQYTDLSNNEILLCAYLKMNLSTKEIAPLLNISQRGVETMRYRLRKKLGLEREESLTSFITNLR